MRGNTRQLVCQKSKIVVLILLQKHTIDWCNIVPCHPGNSWTKQINVQHLCWLKMCNISQSFCRPASPFWKTKNIYKTSTYLLKIFYDSYANPQCDLVFVPSPPCDVTLLQVSDTWKSMLDAMSQHTQWAEKQWMWWQRSPALYFFTQQLKKSE